MTPHTAVFVLATLTFLGAGCAKREPPVAPPPFQQPAAAPSPDAATPTAPPTAADAVPTSPAPSAVEGPPPTTEGAKPPNGTPAAQAPIAPREISITAKQWAFEPAEIRLQKGTPVVLVVTSTDVDHGLLISALNVNAKLTPGSTVRIAVTPTTAGTFPMICNVFCGAGHKDMRGSIIVE